MKLKYNLNNKRAFTIVELLVVIAVVGLLSSTVLTVSGGIRKNSRDAKRMADLSQLQKMLELYQFRTADNSYPLSTGDFQIEGHPWGSFWENYGAVPKDPLSPQQNYAYVSDGSSYQTYAKFEAELPPGSFFSCGTPCGPQGGYVGGVASPNSVLATSTGEGGLGGDGGGDGGGGGGDGGSLPEEETIICEPSLATGQQVFNVSTRTNPKITQVIVNPLDVNKYVRQEISVGIQETAGNPITSVTGQMFTNSRSFSFTLSLTSGTETDGTWSGAWFNEDSYCQNYLLKITAVSESGQGVVELAFR